MQPRRSPAGVCSDTKAPAGRRSASSKSSSFQSAARPCSAASMDCRAIWSNRFRCASVSMPMDQHQVANVDDQAGCLPHDEDRIAAMNGVGERDRAPDHRQIPELNRDVALPLTLRGDPLDDESPGEEKLADKADENPEIPRSRIEAHDSSLTL